MKNELFERVLDEEKRIISREEETENYKKYRHYTTEATNELKRNRAEAGCPSVEVLRAYLNANKWNSEMLIIESFWESDDLLKTLESGNIKEFYLTDESSGLMKRIHDITRVGWKMEAVVIKHPYYKQMNSETGKMEPEENMAIRFTK